ncbi:branched-chain amino acid aminotransferase [Amaricoccus macauensis]|uniref:branched-chain amino acid aminotransferase n=1 Tax=Amaricoccus macauensis TaxID=57001 RepID=UPI003C7C9665
MAIGSECVTWYEGQWHKGNTPILGAADHATWLGTLVFDGARAFDGAIPDLDLHCARLIRSAEIMGLSPCTQAEEIEALCREGVRRLGSDRPLYIRPMMWSREGSPAMIDPDPASTAFAVCVEDLAFIEPGHFSLTMSPFRRPAPDSALNDAKAASHYANNGRIIAEARKRGFSNAVSLDQQGFVAETGSSNIFIVTDGVVRTPIPNGTFLNGITRQRVISLLREDGAEVLEMRLLPEDIAQADEIFITANAQKIVPVTRFEDREFRSISTGQRARALYWEYALQSRKAA